MIQVSRLPSRLSFLLTHKMDWVRTDCSMDLLCRNL